jgi:hypothetical protein
MKEISISASKTPTKYSCLTNGIFPVMAGGNIWKKWFVIRSRSPNRVNAIIYTKRSIQYPPTCSNTKPIHAGRNLPAKMEKKIDREEKTNSTEYTE